MADQPSRRWFASQTMDLMIWYDHANRPVSFQLAYDKSSNEHAIVWRRHQGLRHHRVDDGEDNPRANATPLLLPANAPDWIAIEQAFCRQSAQLKPDIVQLVRDQLRAGRLAAADLSRWINTLNRRDIIYCYDLELPEDFQPTPTDGEVADFLLLPIDKVIELVAETDRFKPNCNLVIIDFLLRHGLLGPEHPQYDALALGLRVHP